MALCHISMLSMVETHGFCLWWTLGYDDCEAMVSKSRSHIDWKTCYSSSYRGLERQSLWVSFLVMLCDACVHIYLYMEYKAFARDFIWKSVSSHTWIKHVLDNSNQLAWSHFFVVFLLRAFLWCMIFFGCRLLRQKAASFLMDDIYRNPGPLQFDGPGADAKVITLSVEDQDYMGRIKKLQEYLEQVLPIKKLSFLQN